MIRIVDLNFALKQNFYFYFYDNDYRSYLYQCVDRIKLFINDKNTLSQIWKPSLRQFLLALY